MGMARLDDASSAHPGTNVTGARRFALGCTFLVLTAGSLAAGSLTAGCALSHERVETLCVDI